MNENADRTLRQYVVEVVETKVKNYVVYAVDEIDARDNYGRDGWRPGDDSRFEEVLSVKRLRMRE